MAPAAPENAKSLGIHREQRQIVDKSLPLFKVALRPDSLGPSAQRGGREGRANQE